MLNVDQKVGSISRFLQRLEEIEKKKGGIRYFRGHSKASFKLEPSIYRNDGLIANEATMLKELIVRCPNDFSGGISTFQTLVKMQHYGLPTRLLDITSNPLVALYFACTLHERDDEDGEVIVVGFDLEKEVKYYDSDTVSVIANLSRRPASFKRPPITDKHKFNSHPDVKLLLHDIRQDRPYFQAEIIPDHLGKVICVKPLLDNPRIIRQDGAFLLFGIDGDKTKPATLEHHSVIARIKINRDKKKELTVQLEALGISRATLFPEIEQVATHIKTIYETPDLSVLSKLTEQQTKVIHALASGVAKNVREVATQLGVKAASVSQSISNLYGKKLIERAGSGRGVRWQAIDAVKDKLDKGRHS